MSSEVTWRVSPHVFSDIHEIWSKHLGQILWDRMMTELDGIPRSIGADMAAEEIAAKYGLRKYTSYKLVVDYKLATYLSPEY
jgi:hypothetical protein